MEEGAAVQPLAIAIHACNRAAIKIGDNIAIFGAGPIGILCAMSARAMGAGKILITGEKDWYSSKNRRRLANLSLNMS